MAAAAAAAAAGDYQKVKWSSKVLGSRTDHPLPIAAAAAAAAVAESY